MELQFSLQGSFTSSADASPARGVIVAFFTEATDFISVKPVSAKNLFTVANITFFEVEDSLFVPFEDLEKTVSQIKTVAPDAEVEEPFGVFTLETLYENELPVVPGEVSNEYVVVDLTLPELVGDFNISGFTELTANLPTDTTLGTASEA